MTFEFQIVSQDVLSLLALKLSLFQAVLQRSQFLKTQTSFTQLFIFAFTISKQESEKYLPWYLPPFF